MREVQGAESSDFVATTDSVESATMGSVESVEPATTDTTEPVEAAEP